MRALKSIIVIVACSTLSTGCTTFAKRTFKEMKGAGSEYEQVPGTAAGSFTRFASVTIAEPRSDAGSLVSSTFKTQLVSQLRKRLTGESDSPFRASGSPTLNIEPQIQWYHRGGGLFPNKYAVVIFFLNGDGADLGRVQVVTESEASGTGDDDMASSMAKEMVNYFEKHGKKKG
jgi:hypothetical protein